MHEVPHKEAAGVAGLALCERVERLSGKARQIRIDLLTMIHEAGDGHPGPALSSCDIITALYFDVMNIDPEKPRSPSRDRFILSKGHACTALYAALAERGYFSKSLLSGFRSLGSPLQGHPVMQKTPGVDMTTGSLGHGLSVGAGMAAAASLSGENFRVYVLMGDGELNEGIVWEGAAIAAAMKLDNLTVFIDANGFQSGGTVASVSGSAGIAERFSSFGWNCLEIDGHDFAQILSSIDTARAQTSGPTLIVAKTVKGKGVPYMENDNAWHKGVPDAQQLATALAALNVPGSHMNHPAGERP